MDYVNFLGILLVLVLVAVVWLDLRRIALDIRQVATESQRRLPPREPHHHYTWVASARSEEYNVWAYRGGQWELQRQCSAPGFEVGPPPGRKGWYEGEIVKTRGVQV